MVRCWSLPLGSHRQQQHLETWNVFTEADLQSGVDSQKTDVLFDKYYEFSIKGGTRKRHGLSAVAIKWMIESRNIPLFSKMGQLPCCHKSLSWKHLDRQNHCCRWWGQQLIARRNVWPTSRCGSFWSQTWICWHKDHPAPCKESGCKHRCFCKGHRCSCATVSTSAQDAVQKKRW